MKKNDLFVRITLLLVVILNVTNAWAQNLSVAGKVTDKADGSALPGVSVSVKGTTTGTTTDASGAYKLNVPSSATLVFSFVGYASQEVTVGSRTAIDIQLSPDVKALSEVVVIGYGEAKKKDLTGAVAQVSAKDFNPGVNSNALQSIQGKVAGLVITQPSGDPNDAPTVRLRGYTSLAGGSDPLYVVDGVIGVPITTIAPSDIETMDVLKDASAAAIYGARAANGVIIVTTKRGKSGKPTLSFNNYVSVSTFARRFDMLDANGYRAEVERVDGAASLNDANRFPTDKNGNGYNTNWLDQISRLGVVDNHDLALSGGGENFSYRASLNYMNNQGNIKKTGFERVTGRFNVDQKALHNRLNVQYNLSLSSTNSQQVNKTPVGSGINNDIITAAYTFLPTLPVYDSTGHYYEVGGSFNLLNPVAMQNNYQNNKTYRVLIGGVNLKYELLDGLTLGASGSYRNENTLTQQAYNASVKAYQGNQGYAGQNYDEVNNKLLELTANYTKNLGDLGNFSFLGGYSYQDNINDGFGANNNNFVPGAYDIFGYNNLGRGAGSLSFGSTGYTSSYKNEWKLVSFFGRATFNILDKYNLTATLRRDGSSKFGANNKWGTFPSVAAGWTISNEDFLRDNTTLSYLKLRVGWGQTGNSEGINPYKSLQLYGPASNYYSGYVSDFVPGYGYSQNANPNLKWEVLEQTNVGVDFTLFNRINGTVEIYQKDTKDMLYPYNVPANGQYVTPTIIANVGTMRNRGIELSLGADVIRKGDFSWNARLVGSAYHNTVLSLSNSQFSVGLVRYNAFGGRGLSNVYASTLTPGQALGEFNIPHFVGYSADGQVEMTAKDGGITTDYSQAKLYNAGNAQPLFTATFINTFRYKNFDFNFQLRGNFGNKILNNTVSNLNIPGSILQSNMMTTVSSYPANYSTNQLTDLWLQSGTFVRLDNWQIGYNVPLKGSVIQSARIYVGGNNLFLITAYKGIDPELQVKGDLSTDANGQQQQQPNSIGLDNSGTYPKLRTFQLGVNLTF